MVTDFLFILAFLAITGVVAAFARGSMNAWDDGRTVLAVVLGLAGVLVFAGGLAVALEGSMS